MLFTDAKRIDRDVCIAMMDAWEEDSTSIPQEKFWFYKDECYICIDNTDGYFSIEAFGNPEAAHVWLRGMNIVKAMELDNFINNNI